MSNETNSQEIMSNEANSQATPHISDQPVSQPINLVTSSSEPMEDSSSHGGNNSGANQGTPSRNSESISENLLLHERQPSPMGPLPAPRVEATHVPLVNPYIPPMLNRNLPAHYSLSNPYGAGTSRANAGPSNIHEQFNRESAMRREFGMRDPGVLAGVPLERTTGMTAEETRQLQALTESLNHTREQVTLQAEALEGAYFHAEVAEMIAKGARDAIERVVWIVVALIVLVLALMVKMFL
jgi:hypothetical protein